MLKELGESLAGILRERVVSPLAGAVILAWLYWNWRIPILLFFSDLSIEARIAEITESHTSIVRNVLLPLGTAAVIVALYPPTAYLPYRWWLRADSWKQKARIKYSGSVPWSPEQVAELKRKLEESLLRISVLRDESSAEISKRELAIEDLRARLDEVTASRADESGLSEEFGKLQRERKEAVERARLAEAKLEDSQNDVRKLNERIQRIQEERDAAVAMQTVDDVAIAAKWDREFDKFLERNPQFLRNFKKICTEINDGRRVDGENTAAAVAHDLLASTGEYSPNWVLTDKGRHFARRVFEPGGLADEDVLF